MPRKFRDFVAAVAGLCDCGFCAARKSWVNSTISLQPLLVRAVLSKFRDFVAAVAVCVVVFGLSERDNWVIVGKFHDLFAARDNWDPR